MCCEVNARREIRVQGSALPYTRRAEKEQNEGSTFDVFGGVFAVPLCRIGSAQGGLVRALGPWENFFDRVTSHSFRETRRPGKTRSTRRFRKIYLLSKIAIIAAIAELLAVPRAIEVMFDNSERSGRGPRRCGARCRER